MHWIQRHILKELSVVDGRSYSELLPVGVEGNLFQYHARILERGGYIERDHGGYRLSSDGKELVATMSLTRSMRRSDQPQPVVMIYARGEGDDILLFRWRRQPYRGLVSLPFGRILRGRSVGDMAAEQLLLKTGYVAQMAYLGQVSLEYGARHLLISVFRAEQLDARAAPDGLTGQWFWGRPDDRGDANLMPGLTDILAWIGQPDRPALTELKK